MIHAVDAAHVLTMDTLACIQQEASTPGAGWPLQSLDTARVTEYLQTYASNPLFRSADFAELVIDDNPYRRPVRPEDLTFIDYSTPITRDNTTELSALIGHRMLLNIYDTRRVLLPEHFTADRWEEFELFYSARNRILGEMVRPFLEQHVFSYVHAAVPDDELPTTTDDLRKQLDILLAARLSAADALFDTVRTSPQPERTASTLAIQVLASSLAAPLQLRPGMVQLTTGAIQGRLTTGEGADGEVDRLTHDLLTAAGLGLQPHRYYQYYLPSTLGLMNYLNATSDDHSRVFRHLGAMCARTINSQALLVPYAAPLAELVGQGDRAPSSLPARPGEDSSAAVANLVEGIVRPVVERWGPQALADIARGVAEYTVLLEVHDEDLLTQLTWIDSTEHYREKAERLQSALEEHDIQVDLDTFVESWEECSTTHVHDDDRLLIIESGEMEFWNSFGGTHHFSPGDKMFIPKHRLHGSVVLSGECVYHQPVITREINERFG